MTPLQILKPTLATLILTTLCTAQAASKMSLEIPTKTATSKKDLGLRASEERTKDKNTSKSDKDLSSSSQNQRAEGKDSDKQMGGFGAGNGGGYVVRNGQVEIMDPFVHDPNETGSMTLSQAMKDYIAKAAKILAAPADQSQFGLLFSTLYVGNKNPAFGKFIFQTVLDPAVEFVFVKKLPCADNSNLVDDTGASPTDYGCSINQTTYLLETKFNSMNFRDQALAILHERLHVFAPNAQHRWITGWIASLRTMLVIHERQEAGDHSPISQQSIASMDSIFANSKRLGFEVIYPDQQDMTRTPNGGGWIKKTAEISPDSFVGVTSRAYAQKVLSSTIINSQISLEEIRNSTVQDSRVTLKQNLTDSRVLDRSDLNAGSAHNSELIQTKIDFLGHSAPSLNDFKGKNCELNSLDAIGNQSQCISSKITGNVVFEDGTEVLNSIITASRISDDKLVFTRGIKVNSTKIEFRGNIGDIRFMPKNGIFELDGREYILEKDSGFFGKKPLNFESVEDFLKQARVVAK